MTRYIETPRLGLARFQMSDASDLFQCISLPMTKFMAWDPPSADAYQSRCEALCDTADAVEMQFVIRRKDTGECLGLAGAERLGEPLPELGIWMKPSAHGQGYGREAMRAIVSWASREWQPDGFVYPVATGNTASRKIAEGLNGSVVARKTGSKYNSVVYRIPRQP